MPSERDDAQDQLQEQAVDGMTNRMRRGLLQGAGLGAALAMMGGMISPAQAAEAAFPSHKRWKIVFVNHVTTNPFFVPTQYGIQDACSLLGMDYQWTGSANADVGEMVNAMNAAVPNGPVRPRRL